MSPSMMSQIETGKTQPSVATLMAIANTLRVPVQTLVDSSDVDSQAVAPVATVHSGAPVFALTAASAAAPGARLGPHVQPDQRELLQLNDGVAIERLGQVPTMPIDFIRVTFAPGGSSTGTGEIAGHSGWEYGFVLRGQLVLTLNGEDIRLGPGDAVSFESSVPHRYHNDTAERTVGIWFVIQ